MMVATKAALALKNEKSILALRESEGSGKEVKCDRDGERVGGQREMG